MSYTDASIIAARALLRALADEAPAGSSEREARQIAESWAPDAARIAAGKTSAERKEKARPVEPITQETADALRKSGALYHGEARLRLRLRRPVGSSDRSLFWEMTGPSGTHELADHGTDLERLNAHWRGFASDERNH